MGEGIDSSSGEEPYVQACQCTACNTTFEEESCDIVQTAQAVVNHWNESHPDILENSFPVFRETEQERDELDGGSYQAQIQVHYLTVYDILAIEDEENLFDPAFVESVLINEVCEDCHTPIEHLDDFEELEDQDGPVTKYLCHQCRKDRKIRRRKANNRQLSAFERV